MLKDENKTITAPQALSEIFYNNFMNSRKIHWNEILPSKLNY